jgi:hypothetical protein
MKNTFKMRKVIKNIKAILMPCLKFVLSSITGNKRIGNSLALKPRLRNIALKTYLFL